MSGQSTPNAAYQVSRQLAISRTSGWAGLSNATPMRSKRLQPAQAMSAAMPMPLAVWWYTLAVAVAGLAILTRTELLVVVLGGMFVLITLSVVAQVGYFKLSGGKRLFKMAPLHHHFEMKGWAEQTVVVRFWIICGIFIATGMGLFYAEWVVAG